MTIQDALAAEEQDARRAVHRRLDDVDAATSRVKRAVSNHKIPSTKALMMKAAAVDEAVQIWEATAYALAAAEGTAR